MAAYPYGLPLPLVSGYSVQSATGLQATTFERGNTRQRRGALRPLHSFNLSFVLSTSQLWAWQSWAEGSGYDWQFLLLASPYSGGTLRPHYTRFCSDISIETLGAGYVRASVQAELDVRSVHAYIVDPTAVWTLGGTPRIPSPAWIRAGALSALATDTLTAGPPRPSGAWYVARTPSTLPSDRLLGGSPASPSADNVTAGYPTALAA
jgi:hypothetical protein